LPKTANGAICRASCRAKRPQPLQKTSVCRVPRAARGRARAARCASGPLREPPLHTCRSALRPSARQPLFWRVIRRPSGQGQWHPKHRLPSAVPHAVRPPLEASRAYFCCCAPTRVRACGKVSKNGLEAGNSPVTIRSAAARPPRRSPADQRSWRVRSATARQLSRLDLRDRSPWGTVRR